MTNLDSPYLTVAEAADYARVHEKTIRHWMRDGLKYSKPNKQQQGRVLIKRADLDAFLDR
jgi:excisionase family DNA binding protein